ncbi:Hypothetical protein CINCED_3A011979 [Cinara cedri]|uniref:Uncharacterized protein n=1 Tax=Cinara cedri TaxID=506608 RepID=A0A5E4MKF2_9HEMI|nr:Hypothetical protein CINCED_3A011979 [Cinara cedri]
METLLLRNSNTQVMIWRKDHSEGAGHGEMAECSEKRRGSLVEGDLDGKIHKQRIRKTVSEIIRRDCPIEADYFLRKIFKISLIKNIKSENFEI